jgi:hypothetical protein
LIPLDELCDATISDELDSGAAAELEDSLLKPPPFASDDESGFADNVIGN